MRTDRTVTIWDTATGKLPYRMGCPSGNGMQVGWSADGDELDTLCSGDANYTWYIWKFASSAPKPLISGKAAKGDYFVRSPDRRYLVVAKKDKTVGVVNVVNGKTQLSIPGPIGFANMIAWSPDGTLLAVACRDNAVRVWDVQRQHLTATLIGHRKAISHVAWGPGPNQLSTGSFDGTARIWQVDTAQEIAAFQVGGIVSTLEWSPDKRTIATASMEGPSAKLWKLSTDPISFRASDLVTRIEWGPDGRQLFYTARDKTAGILDVPSGSIVSSVSNVTGPVTFGTWSPNWKELFVTGEDGGASIWGTDGRKFWMKSRVNVCAASTGAWNPNSQNIAVGCREGAVIIVSTKTGETLEKFLGSAEGVSILIWSPNGELLSIGRVRTGVEIWDSKKARLLCRIAKHTEFLTGIAWNTDGTLLATSSLTEDRVGVWNPRTGDEIKVLSGADGAIGGIAFDPGGRRLAASSLHTTTVWDVDSGRTLFKFFFARLEVLSKVAWRPDGRWLAARTEANTIRVRPIYGDDLLTYAQQAAPRHLSSEECKQYFRGGNCPSPF